MRNYSYNKLFDFIKSKLSAQEQADWNTPPDFVFENAMKTINKQKRRDKSVFYKKVASSAALILVLGSLLYLNNRVQNIESKVVNLSDTENQIAQQNSETLSETSITKDLSDNITAAQDILNSDKLNESINKEVVNTEVISPSIIKETAVSANRRPTNVVDDNINTAKAQRINDVVKPIVKATTPYNNALVVTEEKSEIQNINSVSTLQTLVSTIPTHRNEVTIDALEYSNIEATKVSLPTTVGFSLINNYSNLSINNSDPNNNLSLWGHDMHYAGYGFSLDISKALTKNIYVKATGQIQKVRSNSSLKEVAAIDADNFTAGVNGEGSYSTTLNIATPMGEYEGDINFLVDEDMLNRSTNMINKATIDQSFLNTSFDLGAQYIFRPESRLSYFVGTGAGINLTSGLRNDIQSEIYFDDRLVDRIDMSPSQLDDFKSVFWSYYGEAGVQWSINDKSFFSMSVNHRSSINSIKEAGFTGSSSYLRQINVGIGYNIRF